MKTKENTLESNFKKLDEIINKMETNEMSLEESFELYKEGLELIKTCNSSIERVEKEINIITNEVKLSDGEEDE